MALRGFCKVDVGIQSKWFDFATYIQRAGFRIG